jgi:glycerol-3-phosphate dehydrogenase (NAD+)
MSEQSTTTQKVVVVGGGAFGTSLATIAARNGHHVVMVVRDLSTASSINNDHRNNKYFSEFELPPNLTATADIPGALFAADLIVLALPAQIVFQFLVDNKEHIDPSTLLCNSAKGLYLKENCLLSEMIPKALGRDQPYSVLSGPSFAKELMLNRPTAVVVASTYLYHAVTVQRMLSSTTFKVYTSQDLLGVQLGGALKNPLAIGAGIIEGLGLGERTPHAWLPTFIHTSMACNPSATYHLKLTYV